MAILKKIFKKIIRETGLLWLLIEIKFLLDSAQLPLTKAHKALYITIHRLYFKTFTRLPNLVNCKDYNDKIQWLKLFDQDPLVIKCHDKLGVREYIMDCLGDGFVPKVYQKSDNFSGIDFSTLPNSFVLKTNHDSGTVILVRDKESIDIRSLRKRFDVALGKNYGVENGEWAYQHVKPQIFAEEFIGSPNDSSQPPDYKFHCVDGKVKWLQYIYDRESAAKEVIVDREGKLLNIHFYTKMTYSTDFSWPPEMKQLVDVAERLAKAFKYVRADLYLDKSSMHDNESRILVGELTFFPMFGCYPGKGQADLGHYLDFSRSTTKQPFIG